MTLKDLSRELMRKASIFSEIHRNKPFWIWDKKEHERKYKETKGECCFNHIIGLPAKNGKMLPLFDYERKVFEALLQSDGSIKSKHLWIKKSRGLGMSELVLRIMAWLCLRDDSFRGAQMAIITGPRLELAIDMIKRIKVFFGTSFDTKETVIILNECTIRAYPSNANSSRGQPDMKFIFLDEADFFAASEQQEARDAAEGYIGKNDPFIVMVSTANLPGGLYERIEREPEETCVYHRLKLPYTVGLDKIYCAEDIEKARASPSFEREYNLAYGSGLGNIFPSFLVDECMVPYDLQLNGGPSVLAVDPAYGSSNFGIVGVEKDGDDTLYVKEAKQYERPDVEAMLSEITRLYHTGYEVVVCDSSRPEIIDGLHRRGVNCTPIIFNKQLSEMTVKAVEAVKYQKLKIHPGFADLANQLKAISYNERGHPDKRKLTTFDLGDALIMAIFECQNRTREIFFEKI